MLHSVQKVLNVYVDFVPLSLSVIQRDTKKWELLKTPQKIEEIKKKY